MGDPIRTLLKFNLTLFGYFYSSETHFAPSQTSNSLELGFVKKDAILYAATRLFAAQGFKGANPQYWVAVMSGGIFFEIWSCLRPVGPSPRREKTGMTSLGAGFQKHTPSGVNQSRVLWARIFTKQNRSRVIAIIKTGVYYGIYYGV